MNLTFDVTKAYYDVLVADKAVQVAETALQRSERNVGEVKKRYEEQEALKVEVVGVESRIEADRQTLLAARNELAIAKMTLNRLLERDFSTAVEPMGNLESMSEPPSPETALQLASDHNPSLRKARLQVELADTGISRARSYYLPKVQVQGSFSYIDNETSFQGITYGGTLGVTVPFFQDVWMGYGSMGQARAQKQAAEDALRQTTTAVELQVRQASLQVDQARKMIAVAKGQVDYYGERYRVAQTSFREQLSTFKDVLDDHVLLLDNELNYARAKHGYLVALAQLNRAIGQQ